MSVTKEELVVRTIIDDLVIHKLLNGFEKLGLTPSSYYQNRGETALLLMGLEFPKQDRIYRQYLRLKDQIFYIDIENTRKVRGLAKRILKELYQSIQ